MNLFEKLKIRADEKKPLRIGLIGAGKFGSMYLAQALKSPGIHIVSIADINVPQAKMQLKKVGWPDAKVNASSIDEAFKNGSTCVSDDWQLTTSHPSIEIVIECTGNPIAAVEHCLNSFKHQKHVLNVTVEADALCGLMLAKRAKQAEVIYSLAYGDQPALAVELIDWARTSGFPIVAAGRGHKWLPHYRESTPETVWKHWGITEEEAKLGGLNPKMFNAFLDGSKPAIESAAIANSANLNVPKNGLSFPSGSIDDIPTLMRPRSDGGILHQTGLVEVVSCIKKDGTPLPYDIRKGVWVCIKAETDYIRQCFKEYKVVTDPTGQYMSMYRRWHMIGLELGISVASIGLRKEPTGAPRVFNADVIATAKRPLVEGEILDGEGGHMVFGKLCPAQLSIKSRFLPLGLANYIKINRPIEKDQMLRWDDVQFDQSIDAYKLRHEQECFLKL